MIRLNIATILIRNLKNDSQIFGFFQARKKKETGRQENEFEFKFKLKSRKARVFLNNIFILFF